MISLILFTIKNIFFIKWAFVDDNFNSIDSRVACLCMFVYICLNIIGFCFSVQEFWTEDLYTCIWTLYSMPAHNLSHSFACIMYLLTWLNKLFVARDPRQPYFHFDISVNIVLDVLMEINIQTKILLFLSQAIILLSEG